MNDNGDWEKAREAARAVRYGAPGEFKDRKGWLKVFGGLMVFLGLLLLLAAYGIVFKSLPAAAEESGEPFGAWEMLLFGFMLGFPGLCNVVLGWGSITAKRWARAFIRIISGTALVFLAFGACSMVITMAFMSPDPDAVTEKIMGTVLGLMIFGVLFALPSWLVYWFYGRKDTIATVEKHDPVIRWTDKKPLLVIGIALFNTLSVAGSAIAILASLITSGEPLVPAIYFGIVIPGFAGGLTNLAFFGLYAYYTWLFWKLDPRGWWGIFALAAFYLLSSSISQLVLSPMELLTASGMDTAMMDSQTLADVEAVFKATSAVSVLMLAGYAWLLWKARRHFGIGRSRER